MAFLDYYQYFTYALRSLILFTSIQATFIWSWRERLLFSVINLEVLFLSHVMSDRAFSLLNLPHYENVKPFFLIISALQNYKTWSEPSWLF